MQSDKRLYLTVDRERVVEEGDPDAAFLLVAEGGMVPTEYEHHYREYAKPKAAPAKAEPESKGFDHPAETKARGKAEDK